MISYSDFDSFSNSFHSAHSLYLPPSLSLSAFFLFSVKCVVSEYSYKLHIPVEDKPPFSPQNSGM